VLTIPFSRFKGFEHKRNDGRRWGQHFHDYMELSKVTNGIDKVWCDKLYTVDDVTARQMVLNVIDQDN